MFGRYMHLDALDGKQARRLRAASPIGELLDHALDNIGVVYSLLTALNIWGITSPIVTYVGGVVLNAN
jgi:phosphatidylglycerophosphate synthase